MAISVRRCTKCDGEFQIRYRYQVRRTDSGILYCCSPECAQAVASSGALPTCSVCTNAFSPSYAYQVVSLPDGTRRHYCSTACRTRAATTNDAAAPTATAPTRGARKIAVLNQKGGTGKTTTSVSVAAAMAEQGLRTLLIDADAQGHVGVSLGVRSEKTLYHIMVDGVDPSECTVPVRDNLDVITANETLAHAEIYLSRMSKSRDRVLRGRLAGIKEPYDYIIIDCGPAISLINQNALTYCGEVLIPVSCDYLSLVGVKQVLRTIRSVNEILSHPLSTLGVLPTFYDMRLRIARDAIKTLDQYFPGKVLPPVRINTRLREAPAHRKTIFEYDPASHGAHDYSRVARWILGAAADPGLPGTPTMETATSASSAEAA